MRIKLVRTTTHAWLILQAKNGKTLMDSETYYDVYNARRAGKLLAKKLRVKFVEEI